MLNNGPSLGVYNVQKREGAFCRVHCCRRLCGPPPVCGAARSGKGEMHKGESKHAYYSRGRTQGRLQVGLRVKRANTDFLSFVTSCF